MTTITERPPVTHRRTSYRRLYHLHTRVLQAALRRYQANAISREMFADTLICFGEQFAKAANEAAQVMVCRGFLKALKGERRANLPKPARS